MNVKSLDKIVETLNNHNDLELKLENGHILVRINEPLKYVMTDIIYKRDLRTKNGDRGFGNSSIIRLFGDGISMIKYPVTCYCRAELKYFSQESFLKDYETFYKPLLQKLF